MASRNRLVVNADNELATIDKNIYGHFAEHLGRCIYEGVWVGEESSIPNVHGIRTDVAEALKRIRPGVLRWPGGCFAEEYHWRDGIGPQSARRKRLNTHWGGVTETNEFGTHEFFELCEMTGAEPYICGNVSTGTAGELQEWLEYVNAPEGSELSELRASNGHPAPYGLKYVGIGNENWGCGGRMRPEYYADLYRQFQNHVKSYGGEQYYKIACGPRNDDYRWTEVVMREAAAHMDGFALHYYTRFFSSGENKTEYRGLATEFPEDEWFRLLKKALFTEELVRKHSTIMDMYDPERRVALVIDEWGTWFGVEPGTNPAFLYQQNTMRDALVAGISLNIFNNHAERVRMANIAQTVNVLQAVILTEGEKMVLTPTYHVFDMYAAHQNGRLLATSIDCGNYTYGDDSIPLVSASASRGTDGSITITLCNTDPSNDVLLSCEVRGAVATKAGGRKVSGTVLKANAMNAHNTFAKPDTVRPTPFSGISHNEHGLGFELDLKLPAMSVARVTVEG